MTAYLRRATWGLPKARQQEVWDELEEHLLGRATQLQAGGVAPTEALRRALAELGSPARVSAGMTGVYLIPKLVLTAAVGALALSATLYALAGRSEATVLPIATKLPLPLCDTATPTKVKGEVVSSWAETTCYFPAPLPKSLIVAGLSGAAPLVSLATVEQMFQALEVKTHLQPNGVLNFYAPGDQITPQAQWRVTTRFKGQLYFPAQVLIWPDSPKGQTLSGYPQPTVRVGQQVFTLGNGPGTFAGMDFYNRLSARLVAALDPRAFSNDGITGARTHLIQTKFKTGDVVLTVIHSHDNYYLTNYAPVLSGGKANVKVNSARLQFVSHFRQLKQKGKGGRTPALLVRVTHVPLNALGTGIFLPEQATSDAP